MKIFTLTMLVISLVGSQPSYAKSRQSTVCGAIKERLMFMAWSGAAEGAGEEDLSEFNHVENITFETEDKKLLNGYKIAAHDSDGNFSESNGFVLVLLGNAMLASQLIEDVSILARSNMDVYVYDYRGYGKSKGLRRLNAIVEDYKEIVSFLIAKGYEQKVIYGMSFGGSVALISASEFPEITKYVIDSGVAKFSDNGCPNRFDAVDYLHENASNMFLIMGERDEVLSRNMMIPLIEKGKSLGATTLVASDFGHPFSGDSQKTTSRRLKLIADFIAK